MYRTVIAAGVLILIVSGCVSVEPQDTTKWLRWTAVGDDGDSGRAVVYDMRRATVPLTDANWFSADRVSGLPTPSLSGQTDSVLVSYPLGSVVYFSVRAVDDAGNIGPIGNIHEVDNYRPSAITDLR